MGWDNGSGMGEIGVPIMMTPVQGSPAFQINDPIHSASYHLLSTIKSSNTFTTVIAVGKQFRNFSISQFSQIGAVLCMTGK